MVFDRKKENYIEGGEGSCDENSEDRPEFQLRPSEVEKERLKIKQTDDGIRTERSH